MCALQFSGYASAQTPKNHADSIKTSISAVLKNDSLLSVKKQLRAARAAAKKKARQLKASLDSTLKMPGSIAANNGLFKDARNLSKTFVINDSLLSKKAAASYNSVKDKLKQQTQTLSPKKQFQDAKNALREGRSLLSDKLDSSLNRLNKKPIGTNLILQSDWQYQPAPLPTGLVYYPKYSAVFSALGSVRVFGLPINVNLSTNQKSVNGMASPLSSLFKFDLDSRQLSGLYQSQLQRFYELRRDVFAGEDLTGYTRRLLNEQFQSSASAKEITAYLNDPASLNKLLTMTEADMRKQLTAEMQKNAGFDAAKPYGPDLIKTQLKEQSDAVTKMSDNARLQQYLQNPVNRSLLSGLSQVQAADKLTALLDNPDKPAAGYIKWGEISACGYDIAAMVARAWQRHELARRKAIHDVAGKLVGNSDDISQVMARQVKHYQEQSDKPNLKDVNADVADPAAVKRADSIASTLSQVKAQLAGKGFDVNSLLAMQKLMTPAGKSGNLTEQERAMMAKNPQNAAQSILSRLLGLKIGSFGDQMPGSTQAQDMFTNGAQLTFKLGYTPITVGYGSQNDISSLKDADFTGSIYNSPRHMTYLGTQLRGGRGGGLKISFIGSVNKQNYSNQYNMPTISSNNVALTLAKTLKMGKAGEAELDVSKTTTVYSNKYVPDAAALLDKKAGLSNDLANDLFQTLSFGLTHHLDMKAIELSDNVYVNYSGLGYQNPGNNGTGGGQLKLGGNLKKSFYKKKLLITFRTDLKNQAISYTSNDQWKSLQLQLDGRYQISRKFNVDLKYTNNATDKKVNGAVTPVYAFQKLQLDGNATYKIGKNYSVSHFSLGSQSLSNTYAAAGAAKVLMLNYTQTLLVKQKTLTANVFYNRELSAIKLIGNMLNSDISYQLPLSKKISITSGITYLDNTGIARQVGIREGVQLTSVGHFDIGSDVDLRKDLIAPQYPDLYSAVRAEISVKYHLSY